MKIAVVTSSYPQRAGDAAGHFVQAEVRELTEAGHEVRVHCPGARADSGPGVVGEYVVRWGADDLFGWPGALGNAQRRPWRLLQLPGFIRRVRRALAADDYDGVVAHWLIPCAWPICTLWSPRPLTSLEVVVHGSDARLFGRFPTFVRAHVLGLLRESGARLRFVAPHLRRPLQTPGFEQWLAEADCRPCAIDVGGMSACGRTKAEARQLLGIAPDRFVAVVVGRLVASKRVDRALSDAPLPANAWRVVIGSGPLEHQLRSRFRDVHFTGQLPRDVALRWVLASDVVVNASRVEGLPTVVREARALGVPVWTAGFEGAREWSERDPGVRLLPELG